MRSVHRADTKMRSLYMPARKRAAGRRTGPVADGARCKNRPVATNAEPQAEPAKGPHIDSLGAGCPFAAAGHGAYKVFVVDS
jgi:hypothetical protein